MPPKNKSRNPMAEAARQRILLVQEQERKRLEEEERIRKEEEELRRQEEEARLQKEREIEEKKRKKQEKKQKQIQAGTYKTEAQRKRERELEESRKRGFATTSVVKVQEEEIVSEVETDLRAPVICVMGHVDTGKTKLLDNIRQTRVQDREVAGITQAIGASFRSRDSLPGNPKIPGLLFIDTPGHSAFSNLRTRGSSVCDLVILVIDLMKGVEIQTEESIQICLDNNIPFIIALNKVDRLYGWLSTDKESSQNKGEIPELFEGSQFSSLFHDVCSFFWRKELNVVQRKEDMADDAILAVSISALTGFGVDSLLEACIDYCQEKLPERITWRDEFQGFILESKRDAYGCSLDVIVLNGTLRVKDLVGLSTLRGPIVAPVRTLLLPEENSEMRVTNNYRSVKSVRGACGVKVVIKCPDSPIPGFPLYQLENEDEPFDSYQTSIELEPEGATVFAPTLGQLEALLHFLQHECSSRIPIAHVGIGEVRENDLIHMTRYAERGEMQGLVLFCFDVKHDDVLPLAEKLGIRIFYDRTIYRMYEQFEKWHSSFEEERIQKLRDTCRFPAKMSILRVFRNKDPVVLGIRVEAGILRRGNTLCSHTGESIGRIISIRGSGEQDLVEAYGSMEVSVAIECDRDVSRTTIGKAPYKNVYTTVTRDSLDLLKKNFRGEMTPDMVAVCMELKKILKIN